ncbi:MAG: S-methyl-5-thioribose-1-phosphate isomerase [Thermoplasmata archaeon]
MRVKVVEEKHIKSVWFEEGRVKMIDQRKIPDQLEIFEAKNYKEVAFSIKEMVVRGAPAIGAAAAYGMAQAKIQNEDIDVVSRFLKSTRPTAHDLFFAVNYMVDKIKSDLEPVKAAEEYVSMIVNQCKQIGIHGEKLIKDGYRILTHCNAGALATVDYGTALAPIRMAHENKKKIFVYVDETRPRLQGARLTSWELLNEGIEHAIISDNAAGYFMKKGEIDLAIVGADRIASNGDVANKIGTYEKAVLARENGIPFYVAAPVSTLDMTIKSGDDIVIEERAEDEVLYLGNTRLGPKGVHARNPAFDVTPARYITGIITDKGIFKPSEISKAVN